MASTVKVSRRLADWNSRPIRRARRPARSYSGRRVMVSPATFTVPPSGSSSPARQASRVDLPEPDGPTTATISPAPTARETPRSASVSSSAVWKKRYSSCASRTVAITAIRRNQ